MENNMQIDNHFDVLTATASQLQDGLRKGSLTSVMIVQSYLAQIRRHNHAGAHLNAMLSMPSEDKLLSVARSLDVERSAGRVRGPLHGIPIILKDAIATAPELGMETSVGSYALKDSVTSGNATIVDALIENGLIILGKANLTEFCGAKGPPGWSAVGGQTQSPYIRGGKIKGERPFGETSPGGSSSGSAHGVAAGFAPLSIGTETTGSVTTPAGRAALYALKLTPGSTPSHGIFSVTESSDAVGAMGKSVEDVAVLSDILRACAEKVPPGRPLVESLRSKWQGISIGVVDIENWRLSEEDKDLDENYNKQTKKECHDTVHRIWKEGGRIVHISLPTFDELRSDDTDLLTVATRMQFGSETKKYLQGLVETKAKNLQQISFFNSGNRDLEFTEEAPGQEEIHKAAVCKLNPDELEYLLDEIFKITATNGIDKAMQEHKLDLVLGPADSNFVTLATGSRYPIASVPLGYVQSSGRPYGMQMIAKAGNEGMLI